VGNLLVVRLIGAEVWQVTMVEYGQYGGPALGERLAAQLRRARGAGGSIS
jgi:hypothetical protein